MAPLQQPNYAALAQHLAGVVNEVQLIPNAPIANMANVPNQLAQIQQQLAQLGQIQQQLAQLGQIPQQLAQMQQQLDRVEGKLNVLDMLSPIRLHNAVASLTAPLLFPPLAQGVNLPANHPRTKTDLLYMDVQTSQAMANALGLQVPVGAPLQLLRQQVMNYIGALAA